MPRRATVLQRARAALLILPVRLVALLPPGLNRAAGRFLGRLAWRLVPRVRRVALANLEHAYADALPAGERRRVARESAENMGIVAAEFGRLHAFDAGPRPDLVEVTGGEHLSRGAGGVFFSAHYANWEWMGAALMTGVGDLRIAEIVRPLDNPALDAFVESNRRAAGVVPIGKDNAFATMVRLLRDGWYVGVLVDQSPRQNAVPSTFFGRPCWSTAAPALAALRARKPLYPVSMRREADGRYRLTVHPPLAVSSEGPMRERLLAVTQATQDFVEATVRAEPGQWLWAHRRWKRRERLEREWAGKEGQTPGQMASPGRQS